MEDAQKLHSNEVKAYVFVALIIDIKLIHKNNCTASMMFASIAKAENEMN